MRAGCLFRVIVLSLATAFWSVSSPATAAPVAFTFTGHFVSGTHIGLGFSAVLSYDTNLVDAYPDGAFGTFGSTTGSFRPTPLAVTINGVTQVLDAGTTVQNFTKDLLQVVTQQAPGLRQITLALRDTAGTAFSDDVLPITLNPSVFDDLKNFTVLCSDCFGGLHFEDNGCSTGINCGYPEFARIETISGGLLASQVPEPDTLALLGLAALVGIARKRRYGRAGQNGPASSRVRSLC